MLVAVLAVGCGRVASSAPAAPGGSASIICSAELLDYWEARGYSCLPSEGNG